MKTKKSILLFLGIGLLLLCAVVFAFNSYSVAPEDIDDCCQQSKPVVLDAKPIVR